MKHIILSTALLIAGIAFSASHLHADQELSQINAVPFTQVKLNDKFWAQRIKTNRDTTLWYDLKKCEETGRLKNFAVAGGLQEGGFSGIYFNDSDVYKVIEGASYCLAVQQDEKLDAYLDDLIATIASAQEEDGYLYTARTISDPEYKFPGRKSRWTNLERGHELYNAGHLYEAAVAHHLATNKKSLLNIAIKSADLICKIFGPEEGQIHGAPGHEEIEIGLVKLTQVTGEDKYLKQAKFFIDMRGQAEKHKLYGKYSQDHLPVVKQAEAVGHAVRAAYLYSGVADVAALTDDAEYVQAIDRVWENMVNKKMYLTGGIGSVHEGEAFGENYELPNASAYNETCAAIANVMFNHRMFLLHGDAKYIDVLERVLYNGLLSGVSLDGDTFFYPNPLAWDGVSKFNKEQSGRAPWFNCSCCPVNVVRFIPSIPGYVYAVCGDSVYVNLYVGGTADLNVNDSPVTLNQTTNYPWEGKVIISVTAPTATQFSLKLRIPGWAQNQPVPSDLYRYVSENKDEYIVRINGEVVDSIIDHGYVSLERTWKAGDQIQIYLPMPIRRVLSHPNVTENIGLVAIQRGPIVYCVEGADHDGKVSDIDLSDDTKLSSDFRSELLNGITVLNGTARRAESSGNESVAYTPTELTMIPYYAWCHRGDNEMRVWLPRTKD